MTKQQWSEKKQHYPYNVLDMVFGQIKKPEVVDCLRDEDEVVNIEEAIEKLVEPLPYEIRRIFYLHVQEGMTFEQIAESEELSVDVVHDRVALTLRHLRHPHQSKQLRDCLNYPMPMGAILGDVIGSRFEFHNHKSKEFDLFTLRNTFTDDSLMTIAVAKALCETKNGSDEEIKTATIRWMREIANLCPDVSWGTSFRHWLFVDPTPYNSYGNGAAMRVSFVGWIAKDEEEVKRLSGLVTEISHNHPEGLKGAEAVAMAIYLAQNGASMFQIKRRMLTYYPEIKGMTYASLVESYGWDETCQGTLPAALVCFFESKDFEDAIRNAISIGGDSDTVAAIVGSIAEAYYGGIPQGWKQMAKMYCDNELWDIIESIRWSR